VFKDVAFIRITGALAFLRQFDFSGLKYLLSP